MSEYLEKKQNISQIADNFIDFTPEEQSNLSAGNLQQLENSNLNGLNFLRELRPFKCNFPGCNKDYSNKSRLEIHVRTHTGDKPFTCEKCGRSFNEKGNLKIHYRIHTGEKPYKCSYQGCSKEFKAYGHLSDHLKRHFNIRPFKCEICNASFSRRNTLKTHIMTHTGEKPHKCSFPGCNKRFSEKGNMKTHLKTHTRNNKKKFPYSESNELDENMMYTFATGNFGQKSAKEYTENSQVQKGFEFFYLGSKTTSSTTVLTSSPKKPKNESDSFNNSNSNKSQLFPGNLLIEEETENCASPNSHGFSYTHNNTNNNINNNIYYSNCNSNISNDKNDDSNQTSDHSKNEPNFFSVNNEQSLITTNNPTNAANSGTGIKYVTKENFTKKYISLVQNSNAKAVSIVNNTKNNTNNNLNGNGSQELLLGNCGNSGQAPHFNYEKFQEASKINQPGSANSLDSVSNNLLNASTSDSPAPCNNPGSLDVKPNCYNNLNLFFNEDYFPKNNFRNNYGEIFCEDEFNLNFKNNGVISNAFNSDFFSLDNFFE